MQVCVFRKWVFWRQGLTSDLQSGHEAEAPHILSGPDWFGFVRNSFILTPKTIIWTPPDNAGKFLGITHPLQRVCMRAFVMSIRLLVMWGLLFIGRWALNEIYFLLCAFGGVHVHMYVGTHGKQKKLRCLSFGDGARRSYELPDVEDQDRILVLCKSTSSPLPALE